MPDRKSQPGLTSLPVVILLCVLAFVPAPQAQQSQPPKQKKEQKPQRISSRVVVISISGLRADWINDPKTHRLRIPAIQSLLAGGGHAMSLESVFPSQSIPAHASILTGTLPADHGITSDYAFDDQSASQSKEPYRLAKAIKTETIWEYAKREGLTTAAIGFPLTVGANVTFNFHEAAPEESPSEIEFRNKTFATLKIAPPEKTANAKTKPALHLQDAINADVAVYLIEQHQPNLLTINLTSLDVAQLRFGLSAEETILALERIDGFVGKIVEATKRAKIDAGTTFVLLSDRGSAKVEREFRPNHVLAKKGWLTSGAENHIASWRAVAQTFGGSAAIFVKDLKDETLIRELEALFREQHEKPDSAIWRVIPRRDAARLGADPRAALYLDAAPSFVMSPAANGSTVSGSEVRAAHGYSPSRSEMRAALVLSGRGIKPGAKIEYARLIDVAPTIARLLGLEMKTARGRVLSEAIVQ
jgi:predicted AlkP superfamily pyrophosphatase or phosphodiesterase